MCAQVRSTGQPWLQRGGGICTGPKVATVSCNPTGPPQVPNAVAPFRSPFVPLISAPVPAQSDVCFTPLAKEGQRG